jgi:hypothetical protein
LLRVKSPGTSSRTAGSGCFFDLRMHVQLEWESSNFTGASVPLIESLKSKAHLVTDARKWKNLTHLQSILLFKDSRDYSVFTAVVHVLTFRFNTLLIHFGWNINQWNVLWSLSIEETFYLCFPLVCI